MELQTVTTMPFSFLLKFPFLLQVKLQIEISIKYSLNFHLAHKFSFGTPMFPLECYHYVKMIWEPQPLGFYMAPGTGRGP